MNRERHCVPGSIKAPFGSIGEEALAILASSIDQECRRISHQCGAHARLGCRIADAPRGGGIGRLRTARERHVAVASCFHAIVS